MNIQPVRILIASILCSVLILFWGFVYWAVLPMPAVLHKPLSDTQAKPMDESLSKLERGTYLHPMKKDDESQPEFEERFAQEHLFVLSLFPKGSNPMSPITFLQAFAHGLAASVMVGVLLSMVRNSLCCYSHRVFFVAFVGLFATIWVDTGETIWWFRSCSTTVGHVAYHLIAWILAGLVMAAIVKNPGADSGADKT